MNNSILYARLMASSAVVNPAGVSPADVSPTGVSSTDVSPTGVSPTGVSPEQAAFSSDLIVAAVLRWVPAVQRCRLLSVSRAWHRAGDHPEMWHDLTVSQKEQGVFDACIAGDLALLRKRVLMFGVTYGISSKSDVDVRDALNLACKNGHLDIAQWLADHFHLTNESADYSLECACRGGHFAVAKWLAARFNLTAINRALYWACYNKHSAVARWLLAHFGIAVSSEFMHAVVGDAYDNGYLDIVEQLLPYPNYFAGRNSVLYKIYQAATKNGDLAILACLDKYYGATIFRR